MADTTIKAWAVIRKDGQIQHLDGGLAKRLAVFRTKEDAERDCDKKDEAVVPVEVRPRGETVDPKTKEFLRWAMGIHPHLWDQLPKEVRDRWKELAR